MYDFTGLQKLNNQLGQKVGYAGQLGTKQMARLAQAQSNLPDPRLTDLEVSRQHMLNTQMRQDSYNTLGGMTAGNDPLEQARRSAEMAALANQQRQAYNPQDYAQQQAAVTQMTKTPLQLAQEQAQMAALQKQIQAGVPTLSGSTATPLAAQPTSFTPNTDIPSVSGLSAVPYNAPPSSSGRRSSGGSKSSGGSNSGPREWATTGTGGLPGLQNTGGAATGGALGGDGPLNLVKGVQEDYMKQPVVSGKTSYYLPEDAQIGRKQAVPTTGNFSESAVANSNKYQASAKPFSSPQSTGYANSTTYNAPKPSNTAIAGGLAVKEKKKSM